jgi:hypothetical protein
MGSEAQTKGKESQKDKNFIFFHMWKLKQNKTSQRKRRRIIPRNWEGCGERVQAGWVDITKTYIHMYENTTVNTINLYNSCVLIIKQRHFSSVSCSITHNSLVSIHT